MQPSASRPHPPPSDSELIGGRERRAIVLVAHDPAWAPRGVVLRDAVAAALAGIAVRVEHVGSTAVPGLDAKPIVDLQAGVPVVPGAVEPGPPAVAGERSGSREPAAPVGPSRVGAVEARATAALEPLGMELRVRERDHLMYRTRALDVHLHLWPAGSANERRHLVFRDWLRRSPQDRARYQATKRELAAREWEDMNAYAEAKSAVIAEITARAEAWAGASGWLLDPA